MRTDTKNYYEIPQVMMERLVTCGYKSVTPQDQSVFDPYFDKMNDHWSSGTCFSTMIAWKDVFPIFYKIERELILGVAYLRPEAKLVAIPFIGCYTEENVNQALCILKKDFELLHTPLVIMDVVPWMYAYYKKCGINFTVEDDRNYMDYTFTREDFLAGMDAPDDHYRYRYFKRKYAYETEELTPGHQEGIYEFMIEKWCK